MDAHHVSFLRMAAIFQGGLLLFALILGWLLELPPWSQCSWTIPSLVLGAVATTPMFLLLWLIYHSQATCLVRIQTVVREILGRQLAACGWLDLLLIALMAGLSEEFLFRGVLESFFSRWGPLAGLFICNAIFGLCHAVTPTYALLAMLLGCYLSLTLRLSAEPNLVVPIVGHTLYDFVAFLVVRRAYHRDHSQIPPVNDSPLPAKESPSSPSDPGRL